MWFVPIIHLNLTFTLIDKSNIRKSFLTKRKQLNTQDVQQMSHDIYRRILSIFDLNSIDVIASYYAINNEANLNNLLILQPNIYLPIIKTNHLMDFAQFNSPKDLIANKFGIPEPVTTKTIAANKINVCFVPLVAFSRQGVRLGMGGGYYDRYFEHNKDNKKPTKLVGIAYDFQESDTIQANDWDIPLDIIITNKEVIKP